MGVHAHINRCFVNLGMVNWFIRFSSESHNHPKMICNNFKICLLIFYLLFVCLLEYRHRLHLRLNCLYEFWIFYDHRITVYLRVHLNWHLLVTRMGSCRELEFDINKYNGCVSQTTLNNDTELDMDNFRHIKLSQWILNLTVNYL